MAFEEIADLTALIERRVVAMKKTNELWRHDHRRIREFFIGFLRLDPWLPWRRMAPIRLQRKEHVKPDGAFGENKTLSVLGGNNGQRGSDWNCIYAPFSLVSRACAQFCCPPPNHGRPGGGPDLG